MSTLPRFIWCIFDGLRRDMITPGIAPRLRAFIDASCDFPQSRCVFPSVTRVNAAAMACGAAPGATGVVANKMYDPNVYSDRLLHTGLYDDIVDAERAYDGRFVTAPALGEILHAHGMSVAVVSTASAGTTHLLNPRAREQGQVSLCLTDWRASTPAAYAQTLLERHGAIPPKAMPNAARAERQTDMVLDSVLPDVAPDVLMVWYSDPDLTYHYRGIGSPESLAAIRTVDAQFGRILDYCARSPDAERCQVIACSDHGLVTARERIEVTPLMRAAGLPVGEAFTESNTLAGSTGYSGALRVAEHDETGMQRAVSWLIEQPWCGPVFTPGGNGILGGVPATLDLALLSLQHPRTPQVYYAMAADDTANAWGLPGSCYFNAEDIKPGGGTHGGLHPIEMNNLLAAGGSAFRSRYVSPWPASHTDIVPTLLGLLGIAAPETVTGRALTEALRRAGAEPPAPQTLACVSEAGGRRQRLDVWRVGKTAYIDRGWVEQA